MTDKTQAEAHSCINPQCNPAKCWDCACAIPANDQTGHVVLDLLNTFAVNDLGHPFEDGDSAAVDRARQWLQNRSSTLQAAPPAPAAVAVAVPAESALVPIARLKNARALVDRGFWNEGSKILDELIAAATAQEHATQLAAQGQEKCVCTFAQRVVGDGCRHCNPQEYIDRRHKWLDEYREEADAPAQAQEDARNLEAEALRACRDLPEGWEIEIHLERGYGVVTVIDPQGNDDELPVEGTLFDALKETIDTAIRDDAARAAQGGAA